MPECNSIIDDKDLAYITKKILSINKPNSMFDLVDTRTEIYPNIPIENSQLVKYNRYQKNVKAVYIALK